MGPAGEESRGPAVADQAAEAKPSPARLAHREDVNGAAGRNRRQEAMAPLKHSTWGVRRSPVLAPLAIRGPPHRPSALAGRAPVHAILRASRHRSCRCRRDSRKGRGHPRGRDPGSSQPARSRSTSEASGSGFWSADALSTAGRPSARRGALKISTTSPDDTDASKRKAGRRSADQGRLKKSRRCIRRRSASSESRMPV